MPLSGGTMELGSCITRIIHRDDTLTILFEGAVEKVGGIWSQIFFLNILFEGADEKVGRIWSHIIFRQILFEGADEESWRDLEPYNFLPDSFWKVCGIWSHNFPPDSF
jgi:hypothetical protein